MKTFNELTKLLPSVEDLDNYKKSKENFQNLYVTDLAVAFKEKYQNKILVDISYNMLQTNIFECKISIKSEKLNHWMLFLTIEKELDKFFPLIVRGLPNRYVFGTANSIDEFEDILTKFLKDNRTHALILTNL